MTSGSRVDSPKSASGHDGSTRSTASNPSESATSIEVAAQGQLSQAYAALDNSNADRDLVELCRSCLNRFPEDRPVDAGDLLRRLRAHFDAQRAQHEAESLRLAAAEAEAREEARARKKIVGLGALLLLVILGTGALLITSASRRREHETERRRAIMDALGTTRRQALRADWAAASESLARARASIDASPDQLEDLRRSADELQAELKERLRRAQRQDTLKSMDAKLLEDTQRLQLSTGPKAAALRRRLCAGLGFDPLRTSTRTIRRLVMGVNPELRSTLASSLDRQARELLLANADARAADSLPGPDGPARRPDDRARRNGSWRVILNAAAAVEPAAAKTRLRQQIADARSAELLLGITESDLWPECRRLIASRFEVFGRPDSAREVLDCGLERHSQSAGLHRDRAALELARAKPSASRAAQHAFVALTANPSDDLARELLLAADARGAQFDRIDERLRGLTLEDAEDLLLKSCEWLSRKERRALLRHRLSIQPPLPQSQKSRDDETAVTSRQRHNGDSQVRRPSVGSSPREATGTKPLSRLFELLVRDAADLGDWPELDSLVTDPRFRNVESDARAIAVARRAYAMGRWSEVIAGLERPGASTMSDFNLRRDAQRQIRGDRPRASLPILLRAHRVSAAGRISEAARIYLDTWHHFPPSSLLPRPGPGPGPGPLLSGPGRRPSRGQLHDPRAEARQACALLLRAADSDPELRERCESRALNWLATALERLKEARESPERRRAAELWLSDYRLRGWRQRGAAWAELGLQFEDLCGH